MYSLELRVKVEKLSYSEVSVLMELNTVQSEYIVHLLLKGFNKFFVSSKLSRVFTFHIDGLEGCRVVVGPQAQ